MNIIIDDDLKRTLKHIKEKDHVLKKRIEKQLILFQKNQFHSSLRNHKLSGVSGQCWSISITMKIRMLYVINSEGDAYFFDIGTHDEVYKHD